MGSRMDLLHPSFTCPDGELKGFPYLFLNKPCGKHFGPGYLRATWFNQGKDLACSNKCVPKGIYTKRLADMTSHMFYKAVQFTPDQACRVSRQAAVQTPAATHEAGCQSNPSGHSVRTAHLPVWSLKRLCFVATLLPCERCYPHDKLAWSHLSTMHSGLLGAVITYSASSKRHTKQQTYHFYAFSSLFHPKTCVEF